MNPRTAMTRAEPAAPARVTSAARPLVRGRARTTVLLATALLAPILVGCSGQAASQDSDSDAGAGSGGGDTSKSCQSTKTADELTITFSASPCPLKGGKSAKARIAVKDGDGKPVKGATVKVNPEMPSMKMKGGDQAAAADGDGYTAKLVLGMPGEWQVGVQVAAPGQKQASTVAFDLTAE